MKSDSRDALSMSATKDLLLISAFAIATIFSAAGAAHASEEDAARLGQGLAQGHFINEPAAALDS